MTKVNWAWTIELVRGGLDPLTCSWSNWALTTQVVPVLIRQPVPPLWNSGSRGADGQIGSEKVNEKSIFSVRKEQGTTTGS